MSRRKTVTLHFCGTVVVELPEKELTDDRIRTVWRNRVTDEQVAQAATLNRWWETVPGAQSILSDRGRRRSARHTEDDVRATSG